MQSLRDAFNRNLPRSRLRLRLWNRKRGDPPYALYWISLFRRRQCFDDPVWSRMAPTRPRWFRRLRIRTSRDLDTAIHRGGLDACRKAVHAYHARALALNKAHGILNRAVDSVRKMLHGRTAGADTLLDHPPLKDHPRFWGLRAQVLDLLAGVWRFAWVVYQSTSGLSELAGRLNRSSTCGPMRLEFLVDGDHPYGRLLWRHAGGGLTLSRLDDLTRRQLRLSRKVREEIAHWERERRRMVRVLGKRTRLLRRLRHRLTGALRRTEGVLEADDATGILVDPEEYRFTVPEPTW